MIVSLIRVPTPAAASGGEVKVTGMVKLSVKVTSLVEAVSVDHNLWSRSHSPDKVALSSRPRVTVSKAGPSEYVGLRQRSIPPLAWEFTAYKVPPVDNTSWLSVPPLGRVLSMLFQSVLVPVIKR
ncbi:hypothetical protein ES703_93223 [subsurface metagenome]